MLPRKHILLGLVFALLVKLVWFDVSWFFVGLVFAASVLIDVDHYLAWGLKSGTWSLRKSLRDHARLGVEERKMVAAGVRKRGHFHLFHTVEFHLAVLLLGLFLWEGFLWVFFGMLFHSLCDVWDLGRREVLWRREFWFVAWLGRKLK